LKAGDVAAAAAVAAVATVAGTAFGMSTFCADSKKVIVYFELQCPLQMVPFHKLHVYTG